MQSRHNLQGERLTSSATISEILEEKYINKNLIFLQYRAKR